MIVQTPSQILGYSAKATDGSTFANFTSRTLDVTKETRKVSFFDSSTSSSVEITVNENDAVAEGKVTTDPLVVNTLATLF